MPETAHDHQKKAPRSRWYGPKSAYGVWFVLAAIVFFASLVGGLAYHIGVYARLPGISLEYLVSADRKFQRGDTDAAIEEYSVAAAIAPDDDQALLRLGVAARQTRDIELAVNTFKKLVRLYPGHAGGHYLLGLTFLETGRLEDAVRHNLMAIHSNPGFTRAYSNLGSALSQLGRTEEAMRSYRKAIELEPGLVQARENLRALRRLESLESTHLP